DWMAMPQRVGDKIARLIGAGAGEVVVTESTSINLFKVLAVALRMRPGRRVIVSDTENFPTDLYMAEGLTKLLGPDYTLRLVPTDDLEQALGADTAALMLTQVNFRTGAIHDMAALTAAAHAAGALAIWDLSHSAGAVPVDLNGARADFAIGCGYKYLKGGGGRTGVRLRRRTPPGAGPAAPLWLARSCRAFRVRCRLPSCRGNPTVCRQYPVDTGARSSRRGCRSPVTGGPGAPASEIAGAHGG